ncbi:MAG TPA: hypothetical protein VKG43_06155, partial [Acidimicrobiales bacterium]|nr:hypothetical protein [Acidimicrobiales bacterium]
QHQQLDLIAGQYLPDASNPGQGTQRLFTGLSGQVLYTSPADTNFTPPTLDTTSGFESSGSTDFVVAAHDDGSAIKRVVVLYTDGTHPGAWTEVDLVSSDGQHWTGAGAATPSGTIDYMVQAVDGDGNVAVSTNKGQYFPAVTLPTPSPSISIALSGATLVDGYYNGAVAATITESPAEPGLAYSLDGSPSTPVTGPVTITGDGAHLITVTDAADNSASTVVRIDTKPPVISAAVSPVPGPSGWVKGGATLAVAAADAGSGVASLSYSESGAQTAGPTTVMGTSVDIPITASGTTRVSISSTDNVGNTASEQVTVNVDSAAPTVSCASADDNWHNADVSLPCTASDNQSGLGNPSQASFTLSTSVAPGTESASASTPAAAVCDNVGNCTTVGPFTGIKVDKKPPTLTASTVPAPTEGGWLPPGSMLDASAVDGGSGVASITYSATGAQASGPVTVTVNGPAVAIPLTAGGTTTFTLTSTDNVGNTSAPQQVTVNVDAAPPTISCGSADGRWHATDVSIACTASDAGSGLADPSQASFTLSTNVATGTETADAVTNSVVVCDNVGNCATAGPISANMVDKAPPTVTITAPVNGSYAIGQTVDASYSCDDGGSGVASCSGTVPSGAALDTSTPGTYTFSVTGTDNVGNTTVASVTYTVAYRICTPLPPVLLGPAVLFTVQLCDASGNNLTTGSTSVTALTVDGSTPAVSFLPDPTNQFLYVDAIRTDFYTLNAAGLAPGPHTLQFSVAGDPTVHSLSFTAG